MFAIFINGNYIGNLIPTLAHDYAMGMCVNLGDAATLYEVDSYDGYPTGDGVVTYYRNSKGVQEAHTADWWDTRDTWDYFDHPETISSHTLRDRVYAKVRTSRTYMVGDHHYYGLGRPTYMSYLKRQDHKSYRKLSKALIREQMVA